MTVALILVGAWAILVALSMVLSASETAVLLLTVGRVHRLAEAERPGSAALSRLAEGRHRLRATSELVAGFTYVAGWLAGWTFAGSVAPWAGALGGAVVVGLTYSISQALPRTLAVTNPERIALDAAPIALTVVGVAYPLAALLGAPWKWLVSLTGAERPYSPWAVTPEWRGTGESEAHDEREEAEEALLEAVSDFAEKVVREVMVPRTDIHALEDTASVAEAVELIKRTGVSRVPVFHETIDDVRGVLYAKDLLTAVQSGSDATPASLARPPYFVPETKPVEELLREMRATTHIAIVADEYGGTAGLVTLEDLLEEIVGEISDEFDREEPLVVDLGEGRFRVDARLPVDDLNELFGTDLETDADSVGGLFTEVAGRIPEEGESVQFEGLRLTVTRLEGTRIRQLCVESAGVGGNGDDDA